MIFITGPLYSGKRTFAQTLPGKRLSDVQVLAADDADLPKAKLYGHSTCRETGVLAAEANVCRLWLTHYSAAVTDLAPGLAAAQQAFPTAAAGVDGMRLTLNFDPD